MPGLLETAVTGLRVSQSALSTAGHNIANANTPGYSRQRVEVATNIASLEGAGYVGNGATITGIERTVDQFLIEQLRTDTSLFNELEAFEENIRELDTLLSNPSTGLSQGLDNFYSIVENAADDPTSIPSRQLMLSEADNLASRFNTLYERVESVSLNVNQKMDVAVNQINALAENIARLNNNIAQALGASDNSPNDLLDQRDEALRELSKLVSISTVDQGDGLLNVSIGSGQSLVVGGNARSLSLVDGPLDPQEKGIAFVENNVTQTVTTFINGGELGGLLDFRESMLTSAFNELGRVAIVLSDTFNDVHRLGIDLNNQFGGDFFRDVNDASVATSRVFGSANNAGANDRVLSLEIVDSSQMSSTDYRLDVSNLDTSFTITRESDGGVVFTGSIPANLPQSIEFEGLRLNFIAGSFQSGDEFLIRPTRTGARDIELALQRPDQLALASPLVTNNDSGNTGNGQISAGQLVALDGVDGSPLPLFANEGTMSPPLIVRFNSPTSYDILDNSDPGNPVQLVPPIRNQPFVPGQANELFVQDPGTTVVAAAGSSLGIGTVVNGAAPLTAVANGYPTEILSFLMTNPETGAASQTLVTTGPDASARAIASQLSNVPGVNAIGRNSLTLGGLDDLSGVIPLQINLNGVDLIEYDAALTAPLSPDPVTATGDFSRYLADAINDDASLQALGIYAVAVANSVSQAPEVQIFSSLGDDLNVTLESSAGDLLQVTDYEGSQASLVGAGAGNESTVTVGGTFDITMASDITLSTSPVFSGLLGDSSAADFARAAYLGLSVTINGVPDSGDLFQLDFNTDGISDNRNAIRLVNLSSSGVIDSGQKTYSDAYGTLVELVGIRTNATDINLDASRQVLTSTEDLRNSVSAVNLDEEAADLIQFEQIYNANAQVISVARDLFERLINVL